MSRSGTARARGQVKARARQLWRDSGEKAVVASRALARGKGKSHSAGWRVGPCSQHHWRREVACGLGRRVGLCARGDAGRAGRSGEEGVVGLGW